MIFRRPAVITGMTSTARHKNTGVDHDSFTASVEPHRRELHVHCYRMLGSFQESEDLVQETFLRAWRGSMAAASSGLPPTAGRTCSRTGSRSPKQGVGASCGCPGQIPRRQPHSAPSSRSRIRKLLVTRQ
jgi:Sigma-70 region 2